MKWRAIDPARRPLPRARRGKRPSARLPARRRRPPRRIPFLDPAGRAATTSLPRSYPATGSQRARSCWTTCSTSPCTGGTSWDALGLGATAPSRAFHGRDDRRRDGVPGFRATSPGSFWSTRPGSGSTTIRSPTSSRCCRSSWSSVLFHDTARGAALLTGGLDFSRHGRAEDVLHRPMPGAWPWRARSSFPLPNRRVTQAPVSPHRARRSCSGASATR